MKPLTVTTVASWALTGALTATFTSIATAGSAAEVSGQTWQIAQSQIAQSQIAQSQIAQSQIAQSSRAEQTCTEAARDRGLRVIDVISTNSYSGGTEVIMEVRQNRNGSYQVGCDYSSATREVELYEIEDSNSSSGDRNDDNWQNQNAGESVNNRSDAESIARDAVGEQLGIDNPYSSVVRIDNIQRENNNRSWVVEGKANGAPFVVQIRANDGYVQDFQLR